MSITSVYADDDEDHVTLDDITVTCTSGCGGGGGGSGSGGGNSGGDSQAGGDSSNTQGVGGGSFIIVGNSFLTADQWAGLLSDIATDTLNLTISAAIQDINVFRQTGDHAPFSQGSLIDWTVAEINWDLYGASNSSLAPIDVLRNFVVAVSNSQT